MPDQIAEARVQGYSDMVGHRVPLHIDCTRQPHGCMPARVLIEFVWVCDYGRRSSVSVQARLLFGDLKETMCGVAMAEGAAPTLPGPVLTFVYS